MGGDDEDVLTAIAFSMKSTPGAYAALLGAGVSAASGIPTAWGVLTDLVRRLAESQSVAVGDPLEWYAERFGEEPTYEGVLEMLAPEPIERQRLLRGYFEPDSDDPEATPLEPTTAHRSLARLVRSGTVKVIVTLNFDRLMERALRDEGVEPTVVTTPEDAMALAPLHIIDCCVLHLHGDYLNPTSMRNTVTELERYPHAVQDLVTRVIAEHGLVIAGWSATYDPALRELMKARHRSTFTNLWVEPASPSTQAQDLASVLRSPVVRADADTAFGRLADAVDSMRTRQARHPLTVMIAAQTAKRALTGGRVAVDLHDTLGRELAALGAHEHLHLPQHDDPAPWGGLQAMSSRLQEAAAVSAALVATTAYWGNAQTDQWWVPRLDRFADQIQGGGRTHLLELPRVPGAVLLYAGGVAAIAAGRYDVVAQMLQLRHRSVYDRSLPLVAETLAAGNGFAPYGGPAGLYGLVRPILAEVITAGDDVIENAWQRFEVAVAVAATIDHPQFPEHAVKADHARTQMRALQGQEGSSTPLAEAAAAHAGALEELSHLCPLRSAHVVATDARNNGPHWVTPVADELAREVERGQVSGRELVSGGLGTMDDVASAALGVSLAWGRVGREIAWRPARNSIGTIASRVWIDEAVDSTRNDEI